MNTRRTFYWSIITFVGLFLMGTTTSCKQKQDKISPRREKITESVYASGHVQSKNQYQVFPAVNGILQEMYILEGALVKKGDPLFLIRNESASLQVDNARLASEYADWNTGGARLSEMKSMMESAANVMVNDSVLLARQRRLWSQGIQSKVVLEQRELAYLNSLNNYKAAVARYKDVKKQLELVSAQSKKQVAITQSMAKDFTIRSQTDGLVYSITRETGEIVNVQNPIALIGSADDFVLEIQVDENDIIRVQKDQRVLVAMDSYRDTVFEAKVSRIDLVMNERTRTFTVEAVFTTRPPSLYPNLTVETNIIIQERDNALVIPRVYLIGDSMVMLSDESTKKVELGLRDYQKAEIRSGITEKDVLLKPSR